MTLNRGNHYHVDRGEITAETSHGKVLGLVGDAHSILDVGCSTGVLSTALREAGKEVVGIEIDPEAATLASAAGFEVIVADIEQRPLSDIIGGRRFDCVIFADVLEHTRDPAAVLLGARSVLRRDGAVVVSVPNMTHASVRLSLMLGRFSYQQKGLLDRTHVHFFTIDELEAVAEAAGFSLASVERVRADPFAVPSDIAIPLERSEIPEAWLSALSDIDADTFQIVARLIPTAPDADTAEALSLRLAAAREENGRLVRIIDHEMEAVRRLELRASRAEERYLEILAVRDALIGARAELGEVRFEFERFRSDIAEMEEWYQKELAGVHGSNAWKIGRACTWPVRVLRSVLRGPR